MDLPEPNFGLWFQRVVGAFGDRTVLKRRSSKADEPRTYRELAREVREAGEGFASLGVKPGERVGLVTDNRREWLAADLALVCQGAVDVPRGGDSSHVEVATILAHSGAKGAVVDSIPRAEALVRALDTLPELGFLVVLDGDAASIQAPPRVRVLGYVELLQRGAARLAAGSKEFDERTRNVRTGDLLTLVYTSGTTGKPKGVQLTQGNVLSNVLAVRDRLPVVPGDVVLSILPSWHMFERLVEYAVLDRGGCLVYTDARRLRSDLTAERPHLMATVPRIWEGLHQAIEDKVAKSSPTRRRIFAAALGVCLARERARSDGRAFAALVLAPAAALARLVVFDPVRAKAGLGRLRACVSGGGSLPRSLDEYFLALGIPLLNGYGLTETSPVVSVRRLSDNRAGSVGPPLAETEVALVALDGGAVPEGGPGVLHVKGPQVTPGYFRDAELTAAAFPRPGWFDTGDLARIDARGELWIVGRAKDTIALRGGEKVEPERVEAALKASPFIAQAVLVGQDAKNVAALVVADLERLAEALGDPAVRAGSSPTIEHAEARNLLRREIDRIVSAENGFRPYERPVRFAILREPLDAANGMLTATLKVKRNVVLERHAALVKDLTRD